MSSTPDPLEFLKNLWGPMGLPTAGMVAPMIDTDEIDKRIAELKSVENWLTLNLNVLRMILQGLELQKSGLAAIKEAAAKAPQDASPGKDPASALAEAWWSVLQQQTPGRKDPSGE